MGSAHKKGWEGETEITKLLRAAFPEIKDKIIRTSLQESYKRSFQGDVYCFDSGHILSDYMWEVKRQETESPRKWLEKAKDDLGGNLQRPLVVFRSSNKDWLVTLALSDFLPLLQELQGFREQ